MLTSPKVLEKLKALQEHYRKLRYKRVAELPAEMASTFEHFRQAPEKLPWEPVTAPLRWGESWLTAWFRTEAFIPEEADGRPLFLDAATGGQEALLFLDGKPWGTFNPYHSHVLLTPEAAAGERLRIEVEAYAGHSFPSTMPNDAPVVVEKDGLRHEGIFLALERETVTQFLMDLEALLKLHEALDPNSLRKAEIHRGLERVWAAVPAFPSEVPEEAYLPALSRGRELMAPLLSSRNGPTMPAVDVVAHSHIDTAWLWPIAETRRKCARTFSSMLNLMERYPEVIFLQSAPCHTDMVRRDYPELFERVREAVRSGRWEPNGGCWIEPDCNLTGGEALIRQFLHGIRWTREQFGYSSDTLWQPDVFGYSAALPQILRGCNIRFFCTTKMAWNDTTRFPYDTFTWQGIDGTEVLTHLNTIPQGIDPKVVVENWNWAQHKDSETRRLGAYGWGDGGGGPTCEDMEQVRRMEDLEGCPRTRHTTLTGFMENLEKAERPWPRWAGELYLELHRGTLTSIAGIKRGNRRAELRLREAEFLHSLARLAGEEYPAARLHELWEETLVNQFHDILPGSSIARVNDEALESYAGIERGCAELQATAMERLCGAAASERTRAVLFNSLNWERMADITIPLEADEHLRPVEPACAAQELEDLDGARQLILSGAPLKALGFTTFSFERASPEGNSPFKFRGDRLETPHALVKFDEAGRITSCVLRENGLDAVAPGGTLNCLYGGEDVPAVWDNWDIDSDQQLRMAPEEGLVSRDVVADGPAQFRIRSEFRIGRASTLRQDMIFHAASPMITFDTRVDWREKHYLLKAGFDINVLAESARHEIQYGHVQRPTHRNYPQDRARFEVCAHKWTDLSDNSFGAAVLNDCKYGVSVEGRSVRLSLLKAGTHPDERGDNGAHRFVYAFLPHAGGWSVSGVVRPAYEVNVEPRLHWAGKLRRTPAVPLQLAASETVILEAMKWAGNGGGLILRLYEAGHGRGEAALQFAKAVSSVSETNMLEEEPRIIAREAREAALRFRPFEIKTVRVEF